MQCPICASRDTAIKRDDVEDFEYFVRPAVPYAVNLCRSCGSEFLTPRPTDTDLPAFYPDNYHAYHEDHGAVARFLTDLRARASPITTES